MPASLSDFVSRRELDGWKMPQDLARDLDTFIASRSSIGRSDQRGDQGAGVRGTARVVNRAMFDQPRSRSSEDTCSAQEQWSRTALPDGRQFNAMNVTGLRQNEA